MRNALADRRPRQPAGRGALGPRAGGPGSPRRGPCVALDPRRPFAGFEPGRPDARPVRDQPGRPPRRGHRRQPRAAAASSPGYLKPLGYDPMLVPTGDEGFRAASASADVELILVDHHMIQGDWRLHDTPGQPPGRRPDRGRSRSTSSARSPARSTCASLTARFPGTSSSSRPTEPAGPRPAARRRRPPRALARGRARGLRPRGGGAPGPDRHAAGQPVRARPRARRARLDDRAELPRPEHRRLGGAGRRPRPDAQRGLADAFSTRPGPAAELRPPPHRSSRGASSGSARWSRPTRRRDLLAAFDHEADPALRTALGTVIGALRPKAAPVGLRLQRLGPTRHTRARPEPDRARSGTDSASSTTTRARGGRALSLARSRGRPVNHRPPARVVSVPWGCVKRTSFLIINISCVFADDPRTEVRSRRAFRRPTPPVGLRGIDR